MKLFRHDIVSVLLIIILSWIFTADLFITNGVPASFDALVHITNIAQFYQVILGGEFPVTWTDKFANYGLPMPIVAHQLTSYLGAFITFITHNPIMSFNIVTFLGISLAGIFYYLFLRIYFHSAVSFVGTYLFIFTPYRILNVYIRAAIPEVFSSVFIPLILISMYMLIKQKKLWAFFLLIISFALLTLNHPMMLVIYSVIYIPYFFFLFISEEKSMHFSLREIKLQTGRIFLGILAMVLGICLASYYVIPLILEIKYFYYGRISNALATNMFLHVSNFIDPRWFYMTPEDILTRGQVIHVGLFESSLFICAILYFLWKLFAKRLLTDFSIFDFAVFSAVITVFFMTEPSKIIYDHVHILNSIQFPWRMLSAFVFLPPIFLSYFLRNKKRYVLILVILLITLMTFPQLYGKNYRHVSAATYYFNTVNAHSVQMNTIWTGRSEDYPVESSKPAILSGFGTIASKNVKNSSRDYIIFARTALQMVDYTFYFPGWKAFIDGHEIPIEFQNPTERGVITYSVPPGVHHIHLEFDQTKIRQVSTFISSTVIALIILLFLLKNRLVRMLKIPTRVTVKNRV